MYIGDTKVPQEAIDEAIRHMRLTAEGNCAFSVDSICWIFLQCGVHKFVARRAAVQWIKREEDAGNIVIAFKLGDRDMWRWKGEWSK